MLLLKGILVESSNQKKKSDSQISGYPLIWQIQRNKLKIII